MYPYVRMRRSRKHEWIRDLTAENKLSVDDLILPIFVTEGQNIRDKIASMPGVERLSIDNMLDIVKETCKLGIKAIALFPSIAANLKTEGGEEAFNPDNLICRAIKAIKAENLEIGVICDVALDPYTSHGHDGILENNHVHNDKTIEALIKQSKVLVEAGADILAPSDMMDGRIGAIRSALEEWALEEWTLEESRYHDILIISYAAKYASSFYGPFRDAVNSKNHLSGSDKKTYQMDYRNRKEAIREAILDINEGADILMVKPGMPYLDVIRDLSNQCEVPIFAYQVSGEYAMLKFAAEHGAINYEDALIESLTCFKRAGAKSIFTYAALDAAKKINSR